MFYHKASGEEVSIYGEKISKQKHWGSQILFPNVARKKVMQWIYWVYLNLGLIRDIAILFSSIWNVMHILKLMILCTGVKASNGQYISIVLAYKPNVLRTRNMWIVVKKRLISCFPSFGQKWHHVDIDVVINIGDPVAVDTANDVDGEFWSRFWS